MNLYLTWKTKELDAEALGYLNSWKKYNDFSIKLFDDRDMLNWMYRYASREVFEVFLSIKVGAVKSDLWRYCILYKEGGIYADIDCLCLRSMTKLIKKNLYLAVPNDDHGVFQALIISPKKHNRIIGKCINSILQHYKNNRYPRRAFRFSGPRLMGDHIMKHTKSLQEGVYSTRFGIVKVLTHAPCPRPTKCLLGESDRIAYRGRDFITCQNHVKDKGAPGGGYAGRRIYHKLRRVQMDRGTKTVKIGSSNSNVLKCKIGTVPFWNAEKIKFKHKPKGKNDHTGLENKKRKKSNKSQGGKKKDDHSRENPKFTDTFSIEKIVKGRSIFLIIKRTDQPIGWSQHLMLDYLLPRRRR